MRELIAELGTHWSGASRRSLRGVTTELHEAGHLRLNCEKARRIPVLGGDSRFRDRGEDDGRVVQGVLRRTGDASNYARADSRIHSCGTGCTASGEAA